MKSHNFINDNKPILDYTQEELDLLNQASFEQRGQYAFE